MVAINGLVIIALLLCIILLVRGPTKSKTPKPQKGSARSENPRAADKLRQRVDSAQCFDEISCAIAGALAA